MAAFRCSRCGVDWPQAPSYRECPSCGEKTDLLSNAKPLPLAEAASKKKHLEFERFCEARDQQRARAGELSPEEVGRREARALIELDKGLPEWSEISGEG